MWKTAVFESDQKDISAAESISERQMHSPAGKCVTAKMEWQSGADALAAVCALAKAMRDAKN